MKYDDNIFRSQYPVVSSFVHHLAYYRAGKLVYDALGLKSSFWTATLDAHLMIASIQWCKVFGTYGPNPTHWTKTSTDDAQHIVDDFRAQVLEITGLTKKQWDEYWHTMCNFRDGYVAHHEIDFADPIPHFDTALQIAYAYDKWVRGLIHPAILNDLWLKEKYDNKIETSRPIIEAAMKSTQEMKE